MIKFILKLINKTKYLYYIGRHDILPPPLKGQEEKEAMERWMQGDESARDLLIEHNLRLVVYVAKRYDSSQNGGIEDLISIGTIGLIKGVDSFSNKHGTKITTYCARCIENEILMYFRSNNKNLKNVSLNESVGFDKDGNEITILDILKAPKPDFIDEINKKDNIKLLKGYLQVLTDREKEIIIRRYGLNNTKEQTQKMIAKELKISRSYVSRIEKRALTKILREFMRSKAINWVCSIYLYKSVYKIKIDTFFWLKTLDSGRIIL